MRRAGTPAIRVLLRIFVAEHLFKTTTLVIHLDNLVDPQALGGSCGQKEFVDKWTNQFARGHFVGTVGSSLTGDDHAAGQGQIWNWLQPIGDVADVEEVSSYLCFRMLHADVTRLLQACPNFWVVEQMVVTPSRHKAESCVLDSGEGRGITIQSVKAEQRLSRAYSFGLEIGDNHPAGSVEFSAIITIAGS
jgi:hypothetical protein